MYKCVNCGKVIPQDEAENPSDLHKLIFEDDIICKICEEEYLKALYKFYEDELGKI